MKKVMLIGLVLAGCASVERRCASQVTDIEDKDIRLAAYNACLADPPSGVRHGVGTFLGGFSKGMQKEGSGKELTCRTVGSRTVCE
jgi:hypothetical protein